MSRRRGGLGWALAAAVLAAGCGSRPGFNLLVVTLDTTRADFLGCYGKAGARTPNVDRLAAEGTLFEHAQTTAPITLPAHTTMFTGLYPLAHGVRDNGRFRLPDERTTLAEVLKQAGYATGAAIGGFPLTRRWGLAQGFDFYDDHVSVTFEDRTGRRAPGHEAAFFEERPAARVNDAILPWLRQNARRPFFAWVHYYDPHHPHVPPAPFSDLYPGDLYRGEIAYADQALGVLLEELRRQGVDQRTVVAVLGDHGEGRGEHEEDTHSMLAYESTLHVPMILRVPGAAGGRRVQERVGTVDLMPTLLELLGLPAPTELDGRSLLAAMRRLDPEPANRRAYYAETLSPRLSYGWAELRVLYEGRFKYVHGPQPELFDLSQDPAELRNLAADAQAPGERLRRGLELFVAHKAAPTAAAAVERVDRATRDRLAALGYLAADDDAALRVEERLRADGDPPQRHIPYVSLWSRCKQNLQIQDYVVAREQALQLVGHEPGNAFYRALLATAYAGLGQLEQAAAVADQGPIGPQNDYVYVEVARQLYSAPRGRPRAMTLAARVAQAQPSAPALYLLAEIRGDQGDVEGQGQLLRQALELDPGHLRARQSLAVQLARLGQADQAEKEFRAVLERSPLDPVTHLNLGTLLLQGGRPGEGRRHVERALELEPEYWKAHVALLAIHLDAGRRAEARAVLERLSRRCPDAGLVEQARRMMGQG